MSLASLAWKSLYILSSVLIENLNDVPEPPSTVAGQELYFEVLELQPIVLLISFMRTERFSSDDQ